MTVQRQTDMMDPARANALLATLGQAKRVQTGDALPPFFHHIHFWDAQPPKALGRDGHPQVGRGLVPDMGLPRRMWAGGEVLFHAPLRAGLVAEKRSNLQDTQRKTGRSGPLAFVTLRHEIWQAGRHCITEQQDLVYREDPDPTRAQPQAPNATEEPEHAEDQRFDTTTLFRYSALTFNGHRIHYDEAYARKVEGYSGLVVHGPLLAQHLVLMGAATLETLKRFTFRARSPLMHHEPARFCRKGQTLWAEGPDKRLLMEAQIA